jgi:hypothetical protein
MLSPAQIPAMIMLIIMMKPVAMRVARAKGHPIDEREWGAVPVSSV